MISQQAYDVPDSNTVGFTQKIWLNMFYSIQVSEDAYSLFQKTNNLKKKKKAQFH